MFAALCHDGFTPATATDLMLFLAFMDTSGKQDDSAYVVTAGVLFYPEHADTFGEKWAAALKAAAKRHGRRVPRFLHMKEALRQRGEFNGWREPAVNDLLLELVKLTRDNAFELFSAPASTLAYKSLRKSERDKLKGVEELAFEVCLSGCEQCLGAHDQLAIYCDDDNRTIESFAKFLKRRKVRDPLSRDRLILLAFADDRFYPALQAADMLAFIERREMLRRESGDSSDVSPLYLAVHDGGSHTIEYAWESDGDGWGHAVRVDA